MQLWSTLVAFVMKFRNLQVCIKIFFKTKVLLLFSIIQKQFNLGADLEFKLRSSVL